MNNQPSSGPDDSTRAWERLREIVATSYFEKHGKPLTYEPGWIWELLTFIHHKFSCEQHPTPPPATGVMIPQETCPTCNYMRSKDACCKCGVYMRKPPSGVMSADALFEAVYTTSHRDYAVKQIHLRDEAIRREARLATIEEALDFNRRLYSVHLMAECLKKMKSDLEREQQEQKP